MDSQLGASYGHGNRAFLQAMLAHGSMTFEESRPIIAAILTADGGDRVEFEPEHVSEDKFLDYIDSASRAASLFDYEIRTGVHQVTKQRVYALVNTTSDPQTQLATTYNPEELAFVKRVLDAMFDKFNRPRMESICITEMQAIKLARPDRRQSQVGAGGDEASSSPTMDRGLKHSEVEAVLASLVEGGWLEKSREGFYSLTPRALLELRPWLVDSYNDPDAEPSEWQRIKFCEACRDIVTYGLRCAEPSCNLRLHDICQEAYWRSRRGTTCPKCSREWTGKSYVGERSITMTEAYQKGRKKSSGRRSTLADEIVRQQCQGENSDNEGE